jgi:hypothetical protein
MSWVSNAPACQQTCLQDPSCKSFQFGLNGASGQCFTFDVPVTGYSGNGTSGDTTYTGVGYPYSSLWDRNCQDVKPVCFLIAKLWDLVTESLNRRGAKNIKRGKSAKRHLMLPPAQ